MRFPVLVLALFLSGCASHALTYQDIIRAMPNNDEKITGTMYPVIAYHYQANLEKYAGLPNGDSIALSETAKTAGIYLVESYKSGQFIYGGSKKAKRAKRKETGFGSELSIITE